MKKILILGLGTAALCLWQTCAAYGYYAVPRGNLSLYGSYMDQSADQTSLAPSGGGGGVQLSLSLTPNFFIGGSYQYNFLTQNDANGADLGLPSGQTAYGLKQNQGRAGGGLVFRLPEAPLDLFGKIEYVHYDLQYVHVTDEGLPAGNSDRVNDDGVGYHVGFQSRWPGFSIYGSGGYLDLSKHAGLEAMAGFQLPLAPRTWGFFEYRYDNLRGEDNYLKYRSDDYRAGVRFVF
ncbi:MAG: hypothetical protein IRZ06_09080 [Nevskia sp.]|jgi:hypothetical protein|nr:hypothetical protein [Nevskia sp.]